MPNYKDFDLDVQKNRGLTSYGPPVVVGPETGGSGGGKTYTNTCGGSCGCRTYEDNSCGNVCATKPPY